MEAANEQWWLVDTATGTVVAEHVLTAFNSADRKQGLLGRRSFAGGSAMIIAPCAAVHTFFMQFPIDIVFAARNGRIVKARSDVRPWRITAALGSFAVIELPAGTLRRIGIDCGAMLGVCTASNVPPTHR